MHPVLSYRVKGGRSLPRFPVLPDRPAVTMNQQDTPTGGDAAADAKAKADAEAKAKADEAARLEAEADAKAAADAASKLKGATKVLLAESDTLASIRRFLFAALIAGCLVQIFIWKVDFKLGAVVFILQGFHRGCHVVKMLGHEGFV